MLDIELDNNIGNLLTIDITEFNVYILESENINKSDCMDIYCMTEQEYIIAQNIIRLKKLKRLLKVNI